MATPLRTHDSSPSGKLTEAASFDPPWVYSRAKYLALELKSSAKKLENAAMLLEKFLSKASPAPKKFKTKAEDPEAFVSEKCAKAAFRLAFNLDSEKAAAVAADPAVALAILLGDADDEALAEALAEAKSKPKDIAAAAAEASAIDDDVRQVLTRASLTLKEASAKCAEAAEASGAAASAYVQNLIINSTTTAEHAVEKALAAKRVAVRSLGASTGLGLHPYSKFYVSQRDVVLWCVRAMRSASLVSAYASKISKAATSFTETLEAASHHASAESTSAESTSAESTSAESTSAESTSAKDDEDFIN
jgi:hypothetical protein